MSCIPDRSPDFGRIALVDTKLVQIFRLPYSVVNEVYGFTCHATIAKEEALNIPVRHFYLRHQKPVDQRRRLIHQEFHLGWGYDMRCRTNIVSYAYSPSKHVGVAIVEDLYGRRQEFRYFSHCYTLCLNDCFKSNPAARILSRLETSTGGAVSGLGLIVLPMKYAIS